MGKTGYITARVKPELKASAARVLAKVGVSTTDAITMFLTQVVLKGGLPFDVRLPNAETQKAIEELESPAKRSNLAKFDTTAEMLAELVPRKRERATSKQ